MIWIAQAQRRLFLIASILAAASSTLAQSTVTTYQGRLESGGAPATGSHNFVFRLCSSVDPGGVLQTFPPAGTVAVSVTNGLFTQELTFDAAHFNGAERWLEIEVDGTTLSPREHLTSTPYAAFALNADKLDGLDSTAFLQAIPVPLTLSGTSATHVIRGDNASTADGSIGVYGTSTAASGVTYGGRFENASANGYGVFGLATSTSGTTWGVWGQNSSTIGSGVCGYAASPSGSVSGVYGRSDSTTGRGVSGYSAAVSGSTYGGHFQSWSTSGTGVFGHAVAATGSTYGLFGQSVSTSGRGVFGEATATSGTTYGAYGRSASTGGYGVYGEATATSGSSYGVYGRSASTGGYGVYGYATAATGGGRGVNGVSESTSGLGVVGYATSATGTTYGVQGLSASTSGSGVYGQASAASGTTTGVMGQSDSTAGRGVYGSATATTGANFGGYFESNSTSGYGLYGRASATSGTIYGVRGYASTAAGGYAVYAAGDMGASGTKPFRIDHPDDPENKYLLHYAAESPEVINFYRGTVVLNDAGEAVVELPSYFAKINKTPSYQLTAVGAPMPNLHVAEEISEAALSAGVAAGAGGAAPACTFRIAGGAPRAKVSWEVKAVRNDPWVRSRAVPARTVQDGRSIETRAMPVEVEKSGPERGKYQHPEHYGQPRERGLDYR